MCYIFRNQTLIVPVAFLMTLSPLAHVPCFSFNLLPQGFCPPKKSGPHHHVAPSRHVTQDFFRSTLSQWRSAFACQSNKTIQNSCRFNSPSTYPKSNWRTTMLPRFQRPWPPPPVQCCADVHDALGQWRQRLKARGQTPKRSPVGTGMSWQIE